jgi:hypothetical protein
VRGNDEGRGFVRGNDEGFGRGNDEGFGRGLG